ncbi:MAG: UDP-N-acetylmuramoyl-L-alanine--D-glutamate ligase [Clostridiales bacterium]|nr:UDP-N-acetylmuramoyl-L-alanine--D-glutamate ligase [Clostridiales bacterium]
MRLVGKNVVIYGAGASGLSAYQLVRDKGAKAIIYDDKPDTPHATNSKGILYSADVIVLSPGVNGFKEVLLDAKLENKLIISELELASEFCAAEQIAITGTNGKTTTTMLIDHILRRAGKSSYAVGNIGTPFSSIADRLDATETAVIEVSSFQLESSIKFSPDTAVLLNIKPDHLERHGSMNKYVAAKANIFAHQSTQDIAIYNDDDEIIRGLVPNIVAKKVPFSTTHPIKGGAYISSGFVCFDGSPVLELEEVDMRGAEIENLLATVAVCMTHGVSAYNVAAGAIEFERPHFRREKVANLDGVTIYNDSKATNVSACVCACESMPGDTVLILGGAKREENFDDLFAELPASIKAITVSGDNAVSIMQSARAAGFENIAVYDDVKSALFSAFEIARAKDYENILFSPSSKSFDKFESYEMRGKHFNACVKELRARL